MEKYTFDWTVKDEVSVVKFSDKKVIYLISPVIPGHISEQTQVFRRRNGLSEQMTLTKPKVVTEYNMKMNMVDVLSQMTNTYSVHRKSRSWVKKVWTELLCVTEVTSWSLWKQYGYHSISDISLRQFRLNLIDGLVGELKPKEKPTGKHFPKESTCVSS